MEDIYRFILGKMLIERLKIRLMDIEHISPARVAQLVKRSSSKATDLGSIPRREHDPAVGWGDIMFE